MATQFHHKLRSNVCFRSTEHAHKLRLRCFYVHSHNQGTQPLRLIRKWMPRPSANQSENTPPTPTILWKCCSALSSSESPHASREHSDHLHLEFQLCASETKSHWACAVTSKHLQICCLHFWSKEPGHWHLYALVLTEQRYSYGICWTLVLNQLDLAGFANCSDFGVRLHSR